MEAQSIEGSNFTYVYPDGTPVDLEQHPELQALHHHSDQQQSELQEYSVKAISTGDEVPAECARFSIPDNNVTIAAALSTSQVPSTEQRYRRARSMTQATSLSVSSLHVLPSREQQQEERVLVIEDDDDAAPALTAETELHADIHLIETGIEVVTSASSDHRQLATGVEFLDSELNLGQPQLQLQHVDEQQDQQHLLHSHSCEDNEQSAQSFRLRHLRHSQQRLSQRPDKGQQRCPAADNSVDDHYDHTEDNDSLHDRDDSPNVGHDDDIDGLVGSNVQVYRYRSSGLSSHDDLNASECKIAARAAGADTATSQSSNTLGLARRSGGAQKYRYDRQCPSCSSVLSTLYALKLHIAKKHPDEQADLLPLIKQTQWRCMQFPCTVDINCTTVCKGRKELLEHMQHDHGVAVEWIDHTFPSKEDFEKFRRQLRLDGTVFIKATSRYKQTIGWAVYRCNREGNKDERKNRIPSGSRQATIKIGTFCTAYCKIYYEKNNSIRAFGSTTHVNHEVKGEWPEHTMRAPDPGEHVVEVKREDGSVRHEIIKVFGKRSLKSNNIGAPGSTGPSLCLRGTMSNSNEDQVLIATEDPDSGGHIRLDALISEGVDELRTIQEECQTEPIVVYADRLRKFYRTLGDAVSKIVGDDLQMKRARISQGGAPPPVKMLKIFNN